MMSDWFYALWGFLGEVALLAFLILGAIYFYYHAVNARTYMLEHKQRLERKNKGIRFRKVQPTPEG